MTYSYKKKYQKTLETQLSQTQALNLRIITGVFKATLTQILNIKAYLTPSKLKLDKKTDYMAVCLHSRISLLYFYSKPIQVPKTN